MQAARSSPLAALYAGLTAAATAAPDFMGLDGAFFRALVPLAIAGLMGGVLMWLWQDRGGVWQAVRVTLMGLIVGAFFGAGVHAWKPLLPGGLKLVFTGVAGFGAQWILSSLAKLFRGVESNPWAFFREFLQWLAGRIPKPKPPGGP